MKTALFINFTEKEFTGYWDGKGRTYKPGQSEYMPDYLAQHFAKHLTNRELLSKDDRGRAKYPGGERSTSPKKPEDVPLFMELFNKAYTPDDTEELGKESDGLDALIGAANKNREEKKLKGKQDPNEPQMIPNPDFDDEGNEVDGEEFEGKPVEAPGGISQQPTGSTMQPLQLGE